MQSKHGHYSLISFGLYRKQSYLHTITTPNKFVRLYNDGRVLYSSR